MKLKERVAIVTGGAGGIGYATAKLFLEEGAVVAICDIDKEKVDRAVETLSQCGTVLGYVVNIAHKEECQAMAADLLSKYGRIDILINNAGITADAQFYKMTDEQFERVIDVNLKGTYYMSKAVVPAMMEQKYGRIVNASSVSAFNGNFGQSNYAASKAAISGMTRVMGKELGKYGITVNATACGAIWTDMYKAIPEEVKQKKMALFPLRRYGTPEEAARLYLFLASDDASYINTQTITIDGGYN